MLIPLPQNTTLHFLALTATTLTLLPCLLSSVTYSFISPQYVRAQMNYIWNTFRLSGVLISEFGFPTYGDSLKPLDVQRNGAHDKVSGIRHGGFSVAFYRDQRVRELRFSLRSPEC
jgi:hypothetical protein